METPRGQLTKLALQARYAEPGSPLERALSETSAHASSHANGGSDELNVSGLSGALADPQTPATHASSHAAGAGDPLVGTTIALSQAVSNYTPGSSTVGGHFSGIDTAIGGKAATSHTHAAGDVTSGTFANARISEASVTQHEAALDITAAQIVSGDIAIARLAAALLLSAKGSLLTHTGAAFAAQTVGTDGHVLTADSAQTNGIKWAAAGGGSYTPSIAIYKDIRALGTNGGTFTSGAWRTRAFTTEDYDSAGIGSLSGNQITLGAGTYLCMAWAPAYDVNSHKLRLQNITAGTTIAEGGSAFTNIANDSGEWAELITMFTLGSSSALELQHRCSNTGTTFGLGVSTNFGNNEIYATILFWKIS